MKEINANKILPVVIQSPPYPSLTLFIAVIFLISLTERFLTLYCLYVFSVNIDIGGTFVSAFLPRYK